MKRLIGILAFALLLCPLAALAAVDINSADAAALEQVKGIGPAKAAAIVKYRSDNGPFKSLDDLVKVPGIGEKSVEQLRGQLSVGQPAQTGKK
ncbi:MAG: helix-hairpin-helix domain-containing protein [Pseudazoarcus pumilus]|nr:helix-hairpin-helix domain-containing protein [Pseudazoarcus pumilus]